MIPSSLRSSLPVALALAAALSLAFAQDAGFDWQDLGKQTYGNCSGCHQPDGGGVEAAFPPLAGHLRTVLAAEGGRDYLVRVLLYGVQGPIEVEGTSYNGAMPAWPQLSDAEIAAVLNHELTAWEDDATNADFQPIGPDEVAAARGEELTPAQVYELRQELQLGGDASTGGSGGEGQGQTESRSVLDGVFTAAQAERGSALYSENCSECHAPNLGGSEAGPGLAGAYFDFRWKGKTVGELFAYAKTNMPLNRPGSLRDGQYIDIIAHILGANGYPAGESELQPDPAALQGIAIEGGD